MTRGNLQCVQPADKADGVQLCRNAYRLPACDRTTCNRTDLADWMERGGPLPRGLATHVRHCRPCADQIRHIGAVHASLMLLRTQSPPLSLVPRANGRALRMMKRAARASGAATRLLRMRPDLSPWQRAQIHLARVSMGAVAATLILCIRAGVFAGFEQTREAGETLASVHWQRHIDPDGEFLGPRNLA